MLDKSASFLVSLGLVLFLLAGGVGMIVLAATDHTIPPELTTMETAALAGLLGLLGRSPSEGQPPQNVYVQNPPQAPIPVAEQPAVYPPPPPPQV